MLSIKKSKVDDGQLEQIKKSLLQNHWIGFDELRRTVYITTEVHPQNLDKGANPTAISQEWVREVGTQVVDQPGQIVPKKLGGSGGVDNVFPQGKNVRLCYV
jgi:hypothetical protein